MVRKVLKGPSYLFAAPESVFTAYDSHLTIPQAFSISYTQIAIQESKTFNIHPHWHFNFD